MTNIVHLLGDNSPVILLPPILRRKVAMTDEQYDKRILFLNHVKKNYQVIKGLHLVFYFENYDITTIRTKYLKPGMELRKYHSERSTSESGVVDLSFGFEGEVSVGLIDKHVHIVYDITNNCTLMNDIQQEIDLNKIKSELVELIQLLKSK